MPGRPTRRSNSQLASALHLTAFSSVSFSSSSSSSSSSSQRLGICLPALHRLLLVFTLSAGLMIMASLLHVADALPTLVASASSASLPLSSSAGHTFRSLKTFQVHACLGQELHLECPQNARISVLLANYGAVRAVGHAALPGQTKCALYYYNHGDKSSVNMARKKQKAEDEEQQVAEPSSPRAASSGSRSTMAASRQLSAQNVASQETDSLESTSSSSSSSLNCTSQVNIVGLVQAFCREKSICRFNATDWEAIHQMDVCPDNDAASGLDTALPTTYFIELAYKCRPATNYTRTTCEGTKLNLNCSRTGGRIVIFDAKFGSVDSVSNCQLSQSDGSPYIAPTTMHPLLCEPISVTDTITRHCQGRKECTVMASQKKLTAGRDVHCNEDKRRYNHLRVEYSCVDRKVFHDHRRQAIKDQPGGGGVVALNSIEMTADTMLTFSATSNVMSAGPKSSEVPRDAEPALEWPPPPLTAPGNVTLARPPGHYYPSPTPTGTGTQYNCTNHNYLSNSRSLLIGFTADWLSAYVFITRNLERLALYLLVSVLGSLLAFFAVLSCRLYCSKRRAMKRVADDALLPPPLAVLVDEEREPSHGDPLMSRSRTVSRGRGSSSSRRPSTMTATLIPAINNNNTHNGHRQQVMSTGHYDVPTSVRYATLANFGSPSDEAATPSPRDETQTRGTTPSRSTNASVVYSQ